MNRKRLYILPALTALLGLTACSSDTDTNDAGAAKVTVTVNAAIGSPFTRSNPTGDNAAQTAFNEGDEISVSNDVETKTYQLAGGKWTVADGSNGLTAEPGLLTTFQAFYPAKEGNSYDNGAVETDQNTATGLALSDYMTATTSADPYISKNLRLTFQRKTAKVTVNIVGYRDEVADEDRPVVGCKVIANVSAGDKAETDIDTISMKKVTDEQFAALVGPSSDEANGMFLMFSFASKRHKLYVLSRPNMQAGKAYTFNVTVGRDKVTVENMSVEDFTEGVSDGGKATEKARSLSLGTEVTDQASLSSWLETNIGNETGYTLTMTGAWDNGYFTALRAFTRDHKSAELSLDLSQVQGLTEIPVDASFLSNSDYENNKGLASIILPKGVTKIGNAAFDKQAGLKNINLDDVEDIDYYAFRCTGIETLTLPKMVNIGDGSVFTDMYELKEIRFGGDVKSFGNYTFGDDPKLQFIYLDHCTSVPAVTNTTFSYLGKNQKITVYVMNDEMKKAFEAAAGWQGHGFTFVAVQ